MMKHHTRILLCTIGLAAVSACAHPATSSSGTALSPDPKNDIVIAPRMTGGTGMMSFRSTGSRPRGTVEIPVDATGRPEIFAMRFIGTFSEITRRDIADYVSQASFIPGKRNGVPAPGVFKMTFK